MVREIALLRRLHHPNLVQLLDVVVGRRMSSVFLVFEYMNYDLARLIDGQRKPFSAAEIKNLMHQLLSAVAFLHERNVLHRDIKVSNMLYNSQGELKLCDFGLARVCANPVLPMSPKVVTLWYRPPELFLGQKRYTSAVDMWAVGCVMGELLLHGALMPGKTDAQQLDFICSLLGSPTDETWPSMKSMPLFGKVELPQGRESQLTTHFPTLKEHGMDLISRLLAYEPSSRISARDALNHPYFQEPPLARPNNLMPTPKDLKAPVSRTQANADKTSLLTAKPTKPAGGA